MFDGVPLPQAVGLGGFVEPDAMCLAESGDPSIVVAPDTKAAGFSGTLKDFVGKRTVPDDIPGVEHHAAILLLHNVQHGFERWQVGVNVPYQCNFQRAVFQPPSENSTSLLVVRGPYGQIGATFTVAVALTDPQVGMDISLGGLCRR